MEAKLQVLPEKGFTAFDIVNMSENEYALYNMMYAGRISAEDYEYEEETKQEHYAFDGYYDF